MPNLIPAMLGSATVLGLTVVSLSYSQGQGAPEEPVVTVAYSLGFTPEACAIAGISATEAADALSSLAAADTLCDQLVAADAALDAAMAAYSEANTAVRRGLVDDSHQSALVAAETALAEALEDRESAANLLNALLGAGCDQAELERMANCAASGAYNVPAEYRVMGYSDEAWEEIAGAVRQRRRIEAGVFDAENADLASLTGLDDNDAVVVARERLAFDLDAILQSFSGFDGES